MVFSRFSLTTLAALAALPLLTSAAAGVYSYDAASDVGPSHWGDVELVGNQCNGRKNSPIAVEDPGCTMYADYKLTAGTCFVSDLSFSLTNNGPKVVYPTDGSCALNTLEIPGINGTYEALQFHVHTSSEHTIDGSFFGAELHVVHKATDANRYAVVGFVIDPSSPEDDPLFAALLAGWSNMAAMTDAACGMGSYTATMANSFARTRSDRFRPSFNVFNVYDFVKGQSFYHYDGGLTTPPCSEVVWWNLASSPVKMSVAQYLLLSYLTLNYRSPNTCRPATIASPSGSTSRPVQPMYGRKLDKICPVAAA